MKKHNYNQNVRCTKYIPYKNLTKILHFDEDYINISVYNSFKDVEAKIVRKNLFSEPGVPLNEARKEEFYMRYIENKKTIGKIFTFLKTIIVTFIVYIVMWTCICNKNLNKKNDEAEENVIVEERIATLTVNESGNSIKDKKLHKNLDWNLTLVNSENKLPDNYELNLANLDSNRKFDSRAIGALKEMLNAMKRDGVTNVWVQSAYRSVEHQTEIYNKKMNEYMRKGYDRETAMNLTEETINKPGHSDHNIGLAVDFNYVNVDFENTEAYSWLMENAQDYGFILRYPKEKEQVTKIRYEPWHWRYVGKDHSVKMKALNMCLEEYVEYICV